MIAIYAEKPDMGTKIAAALFGIPLENGVVVTFSQLEKYERHSGALAHAADRYGFSADFDLNSNFLRLGVGCHDRRLPSAPVF